MSAASKVREGQLGPVLPPEAERLRLALYNGEYLTRVLVRERDRIVVVQVSDVERLEARGDYVALHTASHRYLVHAAIGDMERLLDPSKFVRIHRSYMVNLDYVVAFTSASRGTLQVELRSGVKLSASRARAQVLRTLVL